MDSAGICACVTNGSLYLGLLSWWPENFQKSHFKDLKYFPMYYLLLSAYMFKFIIIVSRYKYMKYKIYISLHLMWFGGRGLKLFNSQPFKIQHGLC